MHLKINKSECASCGNIFYEWDDSLLEECPHCKSDLSKDKSANVIGSQIVEAELDLITGRISIAGNNPA